MTQLFIDSKEVKLPSEFELELVTENPYFTRVGSYTYDIEIDLRDPANREIYKNINRLDVTTRIKNRKAMLIVNGLCAINGIEVILSIESYTAKIQIIAGNSQLNYEGGDSCIRQLPFDGMSILPSEAIKYPLRDLSCPQGRVYTNYQLYRQGWELQYIEYGRSWCRYYVYTSKQYRSTILSAILH